MKNNFWCSVGKAHDIQIVKSQGKIRWECNHILKRMQILIMSDALENTFYYSQQTKMLQNQL